MWRVSVFFLVGVLVVMRPEGRDLPTLGLDWSDRFDVTDELTGASYAWGEFNYVQLDPHREPAHVFAVHLSRPAGYVPPA